MKYSEIIEQLTTIAPTNMPTAATSAPASGATLSGNISSLQDPKFQAAQLAKQRQEKDKQKKAIQDQIAALQKQLSDLNRTA